MAKLRGALPEPLRAIFDSTFQFVVLLSPEGVVLAANQPALRFVGLDSDEVVGRPLTEAARRLSFSKAAVQRLEDSIAQAGAGEFVRYELKMQLNQRLTTLDFSLRPIRDAQQRVTAVIGVGHDISELKQVQHRLTESEILYRTVVDTMHEGMVLQDAQGHIVACNSRAEEILGLSTDQMLGRSSTDARWQTVHEDGSPFPGSEHPAMYVLRTGEPQLGVVMGVQKPGGALTWIQINARPISFSSSAYTPAVVVTFADITALKEKEQELAYSAYHDPLTRLPNRRMFFDTLRRTLTQQARSAIVRDAAIYLDLDSFKAVNDALGHAGGDELLRQVAERLKGAVRPSDVVARMGGDEFAILLFNTGEHSNLLTISQRVLGAFEEPFEVSGTPVTVGTSLGIAVREYGQTDEETLVRQADVALYRAKSQGKNRAVVYDDRLEAEVRSLFSLERDLQAALPKGELQVHYQPLVNLGDGSLYGAEALMRWNHPTRGMVPPGEFIPLAEANGLIAPMGMWLLEQTLAQHKEWLKRRSDLSLSLNLSPKQLEDGEFFANFSRVLRDSGVEPGRLMLELTETYVMHDVEQSIRHLQQFAHLGLCIAIDDFGTGYSSLSYLQNLPLTHIKVDRSFVRDTASGKNRVLLETVLFLADKLGLRAVAEGIETAEQAEVLKQIGYRWGQGYWFGRPVPGEAFAQHLD